MIEKLFLQGMQFCSLGHPLDGFNLSTLGLDAQDQASIDRSSVDNHRARPAIATSAPVFRAGQVKFTSQNIQQGVADIAKRRFRPIFITSITTAIGLLPTAYGILGENSYITPMVMSMAWGVLFGGLVSLVLLPVLYMVEQDIRAKFSRA